MSQAKNRWHRERNDKRARLKAILVESVRVDGKPVQKHVAFLGSTSIDGGDRLRFWYEVTTTLKRLSNDCRHAILLVGRYSHQSPRNI